MRKLLLVVVCGLVGTGLFAQSIEDVQKTWLLGQVKKAKEEVDKAMNNAKFSAKAEAWLLKASIYSALAGDKEMAAQSEALMLEAVNAFNKTSGELNTSREKAINNWNTIRKRFMDVHVPYKL